MHQIVVVRPKAVHLAGQNSLTLLSAFSKIRIHHLPSALSSCSDLLDFTDILPNDGTFSAC